MKQKRWIMTLIEEDGELVLPLNDEILAATGWQVGDTLKFVVNENGTISVTSSKPVDTL